jgi:ribosomal protein S27AE
MSEYKPVVRHMTRVCIVEGAHGCHVFDADRIEAISGTHFEEGFYKLEVLGQEAIAHIRETVAKMYDFTELFTNHLRVTGATWVVEDQGLLWGHADTEVQAWLMWYEGARIYEVDPILWTEHLPENLNSCPRCGAHTMDAQFELLRITFSPMSKPFDPRDPTSVDGISHLNADVEEMMVCCSRCGAQDISAREFNVYLQLTDQEG